MSVPPALELFAKKVRGAFLASAVGDALGVPVETYSHEDILKATGGSGVTDYLDPSLTRVKDTQGLPKGSTSDDTQLMRVTARSLVRSNGFNIFDQGLCLVEEFERSKFGWGGTTKAAAQAMQLWRDSNGARGRGPDVPAPPPAPPHFSNGSGPAMKVLPLAVYDLFGRHESASEGAFLSHAMDLGAMTHGDARAIIASVALGHAIAAFAEDDPPDWAELEPSYRDEAVALRVIARTMRCTLRAEETYRYFRPAVPRFSERLAEAISLRHDPDALRKHINTGFAAMESVPFAIVTALRHPNDVRAGLLEGVNAGRDTDTIGAMVGAMLGSRSGPDGIPAKWLDGLRECDGIVADADPLCLMAYGYTPFGDKDMLPPWTRVTVH